MAEKQIDLKGLIVVKTVLGRMPIEHGLVQSTENTVKAESIVDDYQELGWRFWSFQSLSLRQINGVNIRVHLLTALTTWIMFHADLIDIQSFMAISIGLFLHKMMHALVSRTFECQVRGIVLMPPFLGLTYIRSLEELNTKQQVRIYAAGPAANLMIALGSYTVFRIVNLDELSNGCFYQLMTLYKINFVIGFVNLLPFYPLDGGRILRVILLSSTRKERCANRITFLFSLVCFYGLTVWFIAEKEYIDLALASLIVTVSIVLLVGEGKMEMGAAKNSTDKGTWIYAG